LISNKVLKCLSFAGCKSATKVYNTLLYLLEYMLLLLHVNLLSVVTLLGWYTSTALTLSDKLWFMFIDPQSLIWFWEKYCNCTKILPQEYGTW